MQLVRLMHRASPLAVLMGLANPAFAQVENLRITEFNPNTGIVEVTNTGPDFTTQVDANFCHRNDCLSFIPEFLPFDEDQIRTFFVSGVNATDSDLWLFKQGPFTSSSNLVHGLKYGPQVGVGSTPLAVTINLWPSSTAFAPAPPNGMTLAWDGFGFTPLDWYIDETPTIGSADSTTSNYVPTGLNAPSGAQDFESILLGDEFNAMTGWQLTDTAAPGLFTIRAVGDVNGVTGPRPGSTSTRWLRIRDQSFLTNTLCSPPVTPAAVSDYTWEFYINNEQAPPTSAIVFPRLMIQHAAPSNFFDLWGLEFRGSEVLLVTNSLAGGTNSTLLYNISGDLGVGKWVKITLQVSFSNDLLIARANDGAAVTIPITPDISVDPQEFRMCYRGDNAGNRHTLLLDDVSIATGPVDPPPPCPGDVAGVSPGVVDVSDLLALLAAWGPCAAPCPPCPEDVADDDCVVNVNDLLLLLANWGTCE